MTNHFLSAMLERNRSETRFRLALARLRSVCASEEGEQEPDANEGFASAMQEVEDAAREVIAGPVRTPADLAAKIAVLQDWYLADFFAPALAEDGAGWAVRQTFADFQTWLPELEKQRRSGARVEAPVGAIN
ncbi:hypothetical protein [Salinarimonas sp.]|uniref:hypothetical protein n=1 Tax=Salinarimonas sp. TaxID=2766526 RepID=UPI0032D8C17C